MIHFAPSILSADFAHLQQDVEAAERGGCDYLHFDVMDGVFVPSLSFGFPVLKCVRAFTKLFLDVHLMITEPERYIEEFAKLGADMITFHYEATRDVKNVIDMIHGFGVKCGIAISPDTPVEVIKPYLADVEMILVMTVNPGFGAQAYIEACTDKVRTVAGWIKEQGVSVDVEVDGGVKKSNIRKILDNGANVIVAGSAVFIGDIEQNAKDFKAIFDEYK